MAYMSKGNMSEIRARIKAEFPASAGWKFSIRNEHFSSANITIVQAPIDIPAELLSSQVNVYWIERHYEDYPELQAVLLKIKELASIGNWDKSDVQTDHFNVGWYVNINIGSWDKPCVLVKPKVVESTGPTAITRHLQWLN